MTKLALFFLALVAAVSGSWPTAAVAACLAFVHVVTIVIPAVDRWIEELADLWEPWT